ncbi:MAG TPA: sugar phosphate isomerase/epimerase family protein [Trueperaceae bacterium]
MTIVDNLQARRRNESDRDYSPRSCCKQRDVVTRFGAHAYVWESVWTPEAARRVIERGAAAGLDFVQIPLIRAETFDGPATKAMLDEYGLAAVFSVSLPVHAGFPEHPQAAESLIKRSVDIVSDAGGALLTGVLYGTLGSMTGHPPTERELDLVSCTLGRAAQYAAAKGISLAIEPVNRYENHLINSTKQGLALIERVGEPNVFLHLDTYHMNIEEKGFRKPILDAGDKLKYIHLSESDRGTPGTGNVHWDDFFAALSEIEYQGDMAMESFGAVNPDIARATCIWRDIAPSPDILVRDGLSFLRAKARAHGVGMRP